MWTRTLTALPLEWHYNLLVTNLTDRGQFRFFGRSLCRHWEYVKEVQFATWCPDVIPSSRGWSLYLSCLMNCSLAPPSGQFYICGTTNSTALKMRSGAFRENKIFSLFGMDKTNHWLPELPSRPCFLPYLDSLGCSDFCSTFGPRKETHKPSYSPSGRRDFPGQNTNLSICPQT